MSNHSFSRSALPFYGATYCTRVINSSIIYGYYVRATRTGTFILILYCSSDAHRIGYFGCIEKRARLGSGPIGSHLFLSSMPCRATSGFFVQETRIQYEYRFLLLLRYEALTSTACTRESTNFPSRTSMQMYAFEDTRDHTPAVQPNISRSITARAQPPHLLSSPRLSSRGSREKYKKKT